MLLKKLLLSSLVKFASSKTLKYEMLPVDKTEKEASKSIDVDSVACGRFQDMVSEIVNTIYLIAAADGDTVVINDSVYSISSYNIPVFAQGVIDAGHIYFNERSANVADEVYHVEVLDENDVLTPAEFNAFWIRYNSSQPDDHKFTLNPAKKSAFHTLSEIELAKMEDGTLGEIGGSVVPGQISQILDIKLAIGSVLKKVPTFSDKELIEWLIQ